MIPNVGSAENGSKFIQFFKRSCPKYVQFRANAESVQVHGKGSVASVQGSRSQLSMVNGSWFNFKVKCNVKVENLSQAYFRSEAVKQGLFMDCKAVKPLNGRCKGSIEHNVKMP